MGYKPKTLSEMRKVKKVGKGTMIVAPRMSVRIQPEMLGAIEKEMKTSGLHFSGLVKKALSEYLERSKELEN